VNCNLNDKARINNNYVLFDSQSTVDVFMNNNLPKNIRDAKKPISLHFNAGMSTMNFTGYRNSLEL